MSRFVGWAAAITGALVVLSSSSAEACGCFAPPSPAEPVIQAGERILFAVDEGKVIAHIQIQYSGQAKDFGWLVPLPSVPVVKVGTNELFTALLETTAPSYTVRQTFSRLGCGSGSPLAFGCGAYAPVANRGVGGGPELEPVKPTPVVVRDSVGAFEYAVLKADDRTEMFTWLSDNRFFVPAGTQDAVGPYVHPGAYFLALKLKATATTGDITPIVLEYPAALPMIPLILTSVGATPDMGVQVWLLGSGRAIPRNFHHVVPNEAQLDRVATDGYAKLLRAAIASAPNKHGFVTEYAGPSALMVGQVVPAPRFGTEEALASNTTPDSFVRALTNGGFVDGTTRAFPVVVRQELLKAFPYPPGFAAEGVTEQQFLDAIDFYLGTYRQQHPEQFGANYTVAFDPVVLARAIFEQHVKPMRELEALFTRFPKLTRMVTILSPEDMTKDPVFSFSATLPDVKRDHETISEAGCGNPVVTTDEGIHFETTSFDGSPGIQTAPALRIETLSEEGPPTVVTDNRDAIQQALTPNAPPSGAAQQPATSSGCSVAVDPALLGLALVLRSLRRRR